MSTPAGQTDAAHPPTFFFVGGGTGGHLFPGIAIAQHLQRLAPGCRCVFICSDRAIDRQILEPAEFEFHPIGAKPIALSPAAAIRFVRGWFTGKRQSRAIYQSHALAAARVVAMGGFVAAPAARAARAMNIPVSLVNLDAEPGKANRWINRWSDTAFSVYPIDAAYAKSWTLVPPIVRDTALAPGNRAHCRTLLGLDPSRPVLMVTGGSQGAGTINRLMLDLLRTRPDALTRDRWQALHQTGRIETAARDELTRAYAEAGVPATVTPLVTNMGAWWGAADLSLGRCGAGTVAEAWANACPALFLPYPFHKDDHQRLNAKRLADAGAAQIATDHVDAAANASQTLPTLIDLLTDAPKRDAMRAALAALGPADGARRVAQALLTLSRPHTHRPAPAGMNAHAQ